MDSLANALLHVRTNMGTLSRTLNRRTADRGHLTAMRVAKNGLVLPRLPRSQTRGQVWGVTMVRDEIDVLPRVLDHLEAQGVDQLLVSDNGSTDGTLEMLQDRAAQGRIFLAIDRETAYYQGAKMTLLSQAARRAGADWIVPFDADELWFARRGLLADALRAERASVVGARLVNTFPNAEGGWAMDPSTSLDKVAFRAHPLAVLKQGNHDVDRPGVRLLRAHAPLRIAHVPWRSFEQFASKARHGAHAYAASIGLEDLGGHWRHLGSMQDEDLRQRWAQLLQGRTDHTLGWTPQGEQIEADPWMWSTWDPDRVLPSYLR